MSPPTPGPDGSAGEPCRHVALVGPTASGKSAVAMAVARSLGDLEIVAADSMQVYRGMDIGTAKPTPAEQAEVRHHGIDLVDPWDDFTVRDYQAAAEEALAGIEKRGRRALLVGGTGLYVQAVADRLEIPGRWPEVRARLDEDPDTAGLHARLTDLDPVAAGRMEPGNRRRVVRALEVTLGSGRPFSSYGPGLGAYPPTHFDLVGLRLDPEILRDRIAARYGDQMAAGLLDEVRHLAAGDQGPDGRERLGLSRTASQALGYRELLAHLRGELTLDEAIGDAVRRTRAFARRQRAWFRRDPRIDWIDVEAEPLAALAELRRRWAKPGADPPGSAARLDGS